MRKCFGQATSWKDECVQKPQLCVPKIRRLIASFRGLHPSRPVSRRQLATFSQQKAPLDGGAFPHSFAESALVRAGSVGRVGVVRGRLVGAIILIVAEAITVCIADAAIAAERVRHDEGQCIAGAAIGIGGGH